MSYNGSGTFQINTSGQPVVTGTVISSSAFNALTADLATGLSTAITKDGQTATTVRIPFAQGINSSLATDTSSGSTGSIYTAGGIGITKGLFVGTNATVVGTLGVTGAATFSTNPVFSALTASSAVATDASKNLVSVTNTGTGNNVLATSPTLITPALGTPASGVVTNLTGTASININGTVGATTPGTGAFTTLSATGVTTVQAGTAALPAITTTGNTNTGIFFPAADTIAFAEGGAEAMRIDFSGNVSVGGTTSYGKITSAASSGYCFGTDSVANGADHFRFTTGGGTTTGSITRVGGTGVAYNVTSDQRLKENIQDADFASALVAALQVRKFDWKADNSHQKFGFVAQELLTIAPDAVHQPSDTEEMMGVDYSKLVPMLTKAIQEQQTFITFLAARIVALETK